MYISRGDARHLTRAQTATALAATHRFRALCHIQVTCSLPRSRGEPQHRTGYLTHKKPTVPRNLQ